MLDIMGVCVAISMLLKQARWLSAITVMVKDAFKAGSSKHGKALLASVGAKAVDMMCLYVSPATL